MMNDNIQHTQEAGEVSPEEAMRLAQEKDTEDAGRRPAPAWDRRVSVVAVLWSLFQLYVTIFPALDAIRLRAWHIGFLFVMVFLLYPASRRVERHSPGALDWPVMAAGLFAFAYMILSYDNIAERGGWFAPEDYAVAA
ncbi:MAG: TRAP transporter permease, partial [Candidatus Accumulibacter sp.]|nr:TRAP transporter permease [Accumulibacter sp.]